MSYDKKYPSHRFPSHTKSMRLKFCLKSLGGKTPLFPLNHSTSLNVAYSKWTSSYDSIVMAWDGMKKAWDDTGWCRMNCCPYSANPTLLKNFTIAYVLLRIQATSKDREGWRFSSLGVKTGEYGVGRIWCSEPCLGLYN